MGRHAAILVAVAFWGSFASASLHIDTPISSTDHVKMVRSWTADLNHRYPALRLKVVADSYEPQTISSILEELELLEEALAGNLVLSDGSLIHLACSRPACDGGNPGGCKTCYIPEIQEQDSLR